MPCSSLRAVIRTGSAAAALAASALIGAAPSFAAGCRELWLERNGIYARKGYCFKTQNAIDYFGRGCFPPYGRLSGRQQRRVDAIKRQERQQGCPGSWSLPG